MNKYIDIGMKVAIVVLAVIVVAKYKTIVSWVAEPTPAPSVVGGDRDSHGCIGSAGYLWCAASNKCQRPFEEFCADTIVKLVDDIKASTDVVLSSKGLSEFTWNIRVDGSFARRQIPSVLYENDDITYANYQKIDKYLSDHLSQDIYNAADGVDGGLKSYTKDYSACQLAFKHNKIKDVPNAPSEPVGDSLTVKLQCGYFNLN